MAITLNANINAGLSWAQKSETGVTTITDAGNLTIDGDLTDGTGYNEANLLWHDIRTLTVFGGETIDLFELTKTMFNDTFDISFSGGYVKAITINNTASGDIELNYNTGILSNPMNGPLRGGSGIIDIPARSAIALSNVRAGWEVSTSQRNLYVYDVGGSGATYEIAIIGITGAI